MKTTKVYTHHDLTARNSEFVYEIDEGVAAVQFSLHVINDDEGAVSRVDVQHLNDFEGVLLTQSCHQLGTVNCGVKTSHVAFPVEIGDGAGNQTKILRFMNHGAINGDEPSKVELTILSETTI